MEPNARYSLGLPKAWTLFPSRAGAPAVESDGGKGPKERAKQRWAVVGASAFPVPWGALWRSSARPVRCSALPEGHRRRGGRVHIWRWQARLVAATGSLKVVLCQT